MTVSRARLDIFAGALTAVLVLGCRDRGLDAGDVELTSAGDDDDDGEGRGSSGSGSTGAVLPGESSTSGGPEPSPAPDETSIGEGGDEGAQAEASGTSSTTEDADPTTGGSDPSTTGESDPSTTGDPDPSTTGESDPSTTGDPDPTTGDPDPTTGDPDPTTGDPDLPEVEGLVVQPPPASMRATCEAVGPAVDLLNGIPFDFLVVRRSVQNEFVHVAVTTGSILFVRSYSLATQQAFPPVNTAVDGTLVDGGSVPFRPTNFFQVTGDLSVVRALEGDGGDINGLDVDPPVPICPGEVFAPDGHSVALRTNSRNSTTTSAVAWCANQSGGSTLVRNVSMLGQSGLEIVTEVPSAPGAILDYARLPDVDLDVLFAREEGELVIRTISGEDTDVFSVDPGSPLTPILSGLTYDPGQSRIEVVERLPFTEGQDFPHEVLLGVYDGPDALRDFDRTVTRLGTIEGPEEDPSTFEGGKVGFWGTLLTSVSASGQSLRLSWLDPQGIPLVFNAPLIPFESSIGNRVAFEAVQAVGAFEGPNLSVVVVWIEDNTTSGDGELLRLQEFECDPTFEPDPVDLF